MQVSPQIEIFPRVARRESKNFLTCFTFFAFGFTFVAF
jgi:hypothetical protein